MLNLRSDFPLLVNNPDLIYLDTASSAQKPEPVIEAISHYYRHTYANIHRGVYDLSLESTRLYENARDNVRHFIGAKSSREVIFTRSATESLNLLSTVTTHSIEPGDEILLSKLEHHANLVPWQKIAHEKKLILKFADILPTGDIDLNHIKSLITGRTKIISLCHCSNVLGTILSFPAVRRIISEQGSNAILIADASQSIPHFALSVDQLEVDFLVFSGHKLYGPSGIGVLWGKEKLLANLPPYQTGGDMIRSVTLESSTWNDLPWKFEAGTPNIEGAIGLNAAIDYLQTIGMDAIAEHTRNLTAKALAELATISEISILGVPDFASGIVSFLVNGMHPHDVAAILNEDAICIRAGHHCAAPLHASLHLQASNRISIGIYTSEEDIDRFIQVLKKAILAFQNV